MRKLRFGALCLLVATALSSVAAGSASAELPALYECGKAPKETVIVKGKPKSVFTGKYTSSKCTTLAPPGKYRAEGAPEGKFEIQEGIGKGKAFKGKGGAANLAIKGIASVSCLKSTDSGKFNTPKTAHEVEVTFTGCETAGLKCTNTATAGEIKTNKLSAEVGYVSGKGTEHFVVGVDIKPESGEFLSVFHCQETTFRVTGSVIGEIVPGPTSPINKFSKTVTLRFTQSNGVQHIEKFEGGLPDTLGTEVCPNECKGSFTKNPSGEETESTGTGESLELKA
jgi:hypothetical protein